MAEIGKNGARLYHSRGCDACLAFRYIGAYSNPGRLPVPATRDPTFEAPRNLWHRYNSSTLSEAGVAAFRSGQGLPPAGAFRLDASLCPDGEPLGSPNSIKSGVITLTPVGCHPSPIRVQRNLTASMTMKQLLAASNSSEDGNGQAPSRGQRLRKIIWRLTKFNALGLLILVLCGFAWTQYSTRTFLTEFPAPGEIVSVNDIDFHVLIGGNRKPGDPVFVIEPGVGEGIAEWLRFVKRCESFAQVVLMDRRGHGYSGGFSLGKITPRQNVDDLKAVLDELAVAPPYVLVGHSMGGVTARLFEQTHPDLVSGLVLIDSLGVLPPEEIEPLPFFVAPLAYSGIVGVPQAFGMIGPDQRHFPPEYRKQITGIREMGTYYPSLVGHISGCLDEKKDIVKVLSAPCRIPVTIISAKGPSADRKQWRRSQKGLQQISPSARCIDLNCHHSVHLVEEDLVVEEFQAMLNSVRPHPTERSFTRPFQTPQNVRHLRGTAT